MGYVFRFFEAFWRLLAEMAPYLWLGFAITFFLKWLVPPFWIRRHLGGEGWRPVLLATVAGLPLPLCSCGVLPVAAAIRREGGGRSGVAAFTVTTPQTGVDSILATAGLLGWGMAFLRLGTALLSGLITGLLVGLLAKEKKSMASASGGGAPSCCCGEESLPRGEGVESTGFSERPELSEAARFAWGRLPADIGPTLVVGTMLAAAVVTVSDWSDLRWTGGMWGAYLLVSVLAVPVYVCSTGVIPLAFGLLAAGFPPGAAFILLTAGPSVSATSLITLGRLIGGYAACLAAFSILVVTWSVGALLDFSALQGVVPDCALHEGALPLWKHIAAGGLVLLLFAARWWEAGKG